MGRMLTPSTEDQISCISRLSAFFRSPLLRKRLTTLNSTSFRWFRPWCGPSRFFTAKTA